jgi:putative sterol carrier protein/uroporphyrinogen-III decarboxylase
VGRAQWKGRCPGLYAEKKEAGLAKKNRPAEMSSHERILAALRKQEVDRIPFVPLIDTYSLLDMPAAVQQALQAGANEGYWQGIFAALKEIGCDIMLRHVYVTKPAPGAPHLNGFGLFMPPVKTSSRMEGPVLVETLETPVGTLTGTWGFTEAHGWIPHPINHVVNNYEELKIFAYAVEHLSMEMPEADFENYLNAEKALGEAGLATTSFLNTPLMDLIETCWGLENTYYLLHDNPSEVEAILEQLHRVQRQTVMRIAESPAPVVIEYENTSSTLLSPSIFKRYCMPILNEYADILRAAGKIFLVHMCGKLKAFEIDLANAHFDGVADISPPPTGNFTLDEAAAYMPGKVVVGGIDATTFIEPDLHKVEAKVASLIDRIKPRLGVLLGSADTVPRGTPLETLRLIQHLTETAGSYHRTNSYRMGEFLAKQSRTTTKPTQARAEEPPALNMQAVLEELSRRLDGKRPDVSGTIKFNVSGECIYRLFIQDGKCRLDASDGSSNAGMTGSAKNLLALFTGKLNPMAAFMTRKIKFEGDLKLLGVLTAAAE